MGSFKTTIITSLGHNLMAKLVAGTATMNFTKLKSSSHDYSVLTTSQLEALTSLSDIKQEVNISEVNKNNDATVKVTGMLLNTELTEGYYINALGLYATDPDIGEILYSITVAVESDWMPPYNNISSASVTYELDTTVSNANNVSINVDPTAIVPVGTFNSFKESVNTQLSDIPNQSYITEKAKVTDVNNALALKADTVDLNTQKARIDNLVQTSSTPFYQKCTSTDTGALLIVSSGATTGQINLASVTPVATGYTATVGDYVRLVYGIASGSAELIDLRATADGRIFDTVGQATRTQVSELTTSLNARMSVITNDLLYEYKGWKQKIYYSVANLAFTANVDRFCTDYIAVYPNGEYYAINLFNVVCFDVNKAFISEITSVQTSTPSLVTFPNNCAYIIVNVLYTHQSDFKFYARYEYKNIKSDILMINQKNYKNTLVANEGKNIPFVVSGSGTDIIYNNSNVPYHIKYSSLSKRIQLKKGSSSSVFKLRVIESLNMSDGIGIWIYVDEKLRSTILNSKIAVRYHENTDYNVGCYRGETWLVNGWNFIKFTKTECTINGTEPSKIYYISFSIGDGSGTTTGNIFGTVFVDSVISGFKLKPTLCMMYDGMWADSYTNGIYTWHQSNSIPCNISFTDFDNLTSTSLNGNETITSDILKTEALKMSNIYGFEMGVYGGYGNNADGVRTGTNIATIQELIEGNVNALSNEVAYTPKLYACSQGIYNSKIEKALKRSGIKIARMSDQKYITAMDKENIFVGTFAMDSTKTLADAEAWLDTLISGGYCGMTFAHAVTANPTTYQVNLDIYNAWLAYIKSKVDSGLLQIMNASEMADMIKNPF